VSVALILLPLAAALAIWLLPLDRIAVVGIALAAAVGEIGLWIATLVRYDRDAGDLQFSRQASWFSDLHVSFHVGVYEYSLWLVGMTVVVMGAAVAYAAWAGRERPRAYFGLMLFLIAAVVAVFEAQDMLLFYVAWEAMLIPLYFLIGVWGGAGRAAATYKFVVYTIAGSLLMLASIIVYGVQQGTFDLTLTKGSGSMWLFLGFAAAFAIKAPLFPFHGWLPQAYRESPPEVAAVLSGVVSKTAAYGFLRLGVIEFGGPTSDARMAILALAAVGLVYGSLVAFRQPDLRGIIAYSSLAQMSLITMGIFAVDFAGLNGAVLQMVNHGLVSGVLFLLAGPGKSWIAMRRNPYAAAFETTPESTAATSGGDSR
jgi:NADH-quinone oxidoreductase subunit M